MPASIIHTCKNCQHGEMRSIMLEGKKRGEGLACLRYPPVLVPQISYDETTSSFKTDVRTHYPLVNENERCGEWKKK